MRIVITTGDVPLGGVLEVPRGSIITPAARELARDRGVPIVEVCPDEFRPPREPHRTVALAADHGGFRVKEFVKSVLLSLGYLVDDAGTFDERPVDYPDLAEKVALAVANGHAFAAVMIDGAGIGSAIAANKVPGIRAALVRDPETAALSRRHNDANILCLAGRSTPPELAAACLDAFLAAGFEGGRHARRVGLIEPR